MTVESNGVTMTSIKHKSEDGGDNMDTRSINTVNESSNR